MRSSIGYGLAGFGLPLRLEIEGDYLNNHVDTVKTGVPERAGGWEAKYGGFFNVLYDIDPAAYGFALPVYPYVGLGFGGMEDAHHGFNTSTVGFQFPGGIPGAAQVSGPTPTRRSRTSAIRCHSCRDYPLRSTTTSWV